MFATFPDLAFILLLLLQYLEKLSSKYLQAAKFPLQYLKSMIEIALVNEKSTCNGLEEITDYTNTNWASDLDTPSQPLNIFLSSLA
jgi:hypothetical protein